MSEYYINTINLQPRTLAAETTYHGLCVTKRLSLECMRHPMKSASARVPQRRSGLVYFTAPVYYTARAVLEWRIHKQKIKVMSDPMSVRISPQTPLHRPLAIDSTPH